MTKKSMIKKQHTLILAVLVIIFTSVTFIYNKSKDLAKNDAITVNNLNQVSDSVDSEQTIKNTTFTTFENQIITMQVPENWYTWNSGTERQPEVNLYTIPQEFNNTKDYIGFSVGLTSQEDKTSEYLDLGYEKLVKNIDDRTITTFTIFSKLRNSTENNYYNQKNIISKKNNKNVISVDIKAKLNSQDDLEKFVENSESIFEEIIDSVKFK